MTLVLYALLALSTPQQEAQQYLQFSCWVRDAQAPRLARVSAFIRAHRYDYPAVVTPPMVRHEENLRRSADLFIFLRREMACDPSVSLSAKFTREEAKGLYDSAAFLLEVSRFLDDIYGVDGW